MRELVLRAAFSLAAVLLLSSVHCTSLSALNDHPDEPNGSGSEVGILYMPDLARAAAADVWAVPVGHVPGQGTAVGDSTVTDSLGQFAFSSLPAGHYNVFGRKGDLVSYAASVEVDSSGAFVVNSGDTLRDTLEAAGSLCGVIGMRGGDDPRKVMVLVIGSGLRSDPALDGTFCLQNLASGHYVVRFLPTLDDYGVLDTAFEVVGGVHGVLPDTIGIPYSGPRKVQGLRTSYDTLMQIVNLSWLPLDTLGVTGYQVYRTNADSVFAPVPLIGAAVSVTVFSDSSATQDQTYVYRVRAVDDQGMPIGEYSDTVMSTITSAFKLVRTIGEPGSGPGQFNTPVGLVVVGDKIYVAEQGNRRVQVLDTLGNFVRMFGNTGAQPLVAPVEIAYSAGTVFVIDAGARLALYDTLGAYASARQLPCLRASDMAVGLASQRYVIRSDEGEVMRYNSDWELQGETDDNYDNPIKLAASSLYVALVEARFGVVKLFSPDMLPLRTVVLQSGSWTSSRGARSAAFCTDGSLWLSVQAKGNEAVRWDSMVADPQARFTFSFGATTTDQDIAVIGASDVCIALCSNVVQHWRYLAVSP